MVIGAPDRVRLVQYEEGGQTRIEAYVQPTLVNVGINERVEVIRGMDLSVRPVEDGEPVEGAEAMEFGWRNHGQFSATPQDRSRDASPVGCPSDVYSGDTASLVAAPNEPLAPVVLFDPKETPASPYFEPDRRYLVTLRVERTVNENPKVCCREFEVSVTQEDIDLMEGCKSPVPIAADPPS